MALPTSPVHPHQMRCQRVHSRAGYLLDSSGRQGPPCIEGFVGQDLLDPRFSFFAARSTIGPCMLLEVSCQGASRHVLQPSGPALNFQTLEVSRIDAHRTSCIRDLTYLLQTSQGTHKQQETGPGTATAHRGALARVHPCTDSTPSVPALNSQTQEVSSEAQCTSCMQMRSATRAPSTCPPCKARKSTSAAPKVKGTATAQARQTRASHSRHKQFWC